MEDQTLLKAKVQNLSGDAGIERMENAISDARTKFFESKDTGSPFTPPVAHISSPGSSCSSDDSPSTVSGEASSTAGVSGRLSGVARSLFKEDDATVGQVLTSPLEARAADVQISSGMMPITENELLVNEIVHEHRHGFADKLYLDENDESGVKVCPWNTLLMPIWWMHHALVECLHTSHILSLICIFFMQAKIKDTMEKAFWDGIMESMKQEQPDYSWVLKLMTEVRDELCEMSPRSWRQEITDVIDIEILSQVFTFFKNKIKLTFLIKVECFVSSVLCRHVWSC